MKRLLFGFIFLIFIMTLGLFTGPDSARGAGSVSDDRKKEIISNMYKDYQRFFPDVPDVTPEKAMSLLKSGPVVLVDSRAEKERKVSTLPGALSKGEFLGNLNKYTDKVVIIYCTVGYRSGKLAQKLRKKKVVLFNLAGGIIGWVHAGGQVYDKNGQTRRIHVYGKKWKLPPEGYEAVW